MRACAYLIAVLAVGCLMSGCKSEDSNPTSGGNSSSLIGTWNLVSITMDGVTLTLAEMGYTSAILILNSDKTYSNVMTDADTTYAASGTWSTSGSNLIFSNDGGSSETDTYSISGTTLTLSGNQAGKSVTLIYNKQ